MAENTLCSSLDSLYRQRDVTVSHVLRLGIHLFGQKDCVSRRRLIDCVSEDRVDSLHPRRRSSKDIRDKGGEKIKVMPPGSLASNSGALYGLQRQEEFDYNKWLHARKALRTDLEKFGLSKQWLCSKERTALEDFQFEIPIESKAGEDTKATTQGLPDINVKLANFETRDAVTEQHGVTVSKCQEKEITKTDKLLPDPLPYGERGCLEHSRSDKHKQLLPVHPPTKSSSTASLSEEKHASSILRTNFSPVSLHQNRAAKSFHSSSPVLSEEKHDSSAFRATLHQKRTSPSTKNFRLQIHPVLVLDNKKMSQPGNAIFQFVHWDYQRPANSKHYLSWQDNSKGYVQFGSLPVY